MRTFIAIEPPPEVRRAIGGLCLDLEPHFPGLRWTRPENIHLTLRFMGEIDPGYLDRLKEAAASAVGVSRRPSLEVGSTGWFGSRREPRVIWLGLRESAELTALAANLEDRLLQAGFGRADKPFRAHLTLARVKNPLRREPDWEAIQRESVRDWPPWEPRSVDIIKSTLGPGGPRYETLASFGFEPQA